MRIILTDEQLDNAIAVVVEQIDYDIAKQYDPDYEGREDPDGPTFATLGDIFVAALEAKGAVVLLDTELEDLV